MKIATILKSQLQQLGSRRVTEKEFLQAKRWKTGICAYTSLSGSLSTFIFIGALGSCRTGPSPSAAKPNPFLREKLLHRHLVQQEHMRPAKAKAKTPPPFPLRPGRTPLMPTTRRAYYSKLRPGDRLQCDWESCIGFNVIRVVKEDSNGKYISCRQGKHYLDGNISSQKTTLLLPNFLLICQ